MNAKFVIVFVGISLFFFSSCELFFVNISSFFAESPEGGVSVIDGGASNNSGEGESSLTSLSVTALGVTYTLGEDGTYSVTAFSPDYGDSVVEITQTVDGIEVTKIEKGAFQNNTIITEVYLPDSILIIEANAFNGSENLKQISLGSGVNIIGDNAFSSTALDAIIIPSSVTVVGLNLFSNNDSVEIFLENPGINSMTWGTQWNQGGNEVHEAFDWHKISFNTQGGSPVAPMAVIAGVKLETAVIPETEKDGFTFEGWYGNLADPNSKISGTQLEVVTDIVFKANWTVL